MKTKKEMVTKRIREIIADIMFVQEDAVTGNTDLRRDLGADSLDIMDITLKLEMMFDVDVEDEEIKRLATVNSIVALITEKKEGEGWGTSKTSLKE